MDLYEKAEANKLAEKERRHRRQLRISQVRQQTDNWMSNSRARFEEEKARQLRKLIHEVTEAVTSKAVRNLEQLNSQHEMAMKEIGEAHRAAAVHPDTSKLKALKQAENEAKAAERFEEAMKQKKQERLQKQEEASRLLNIRESIRQKENDKAKLLSERRPLRTQNSDAKPESMRNKLKREGYQQSIAQTLYVPSDPKGKENHKAKIRRPHKKTKTKRMKWKKVICKSPRCQKGSFAKAAEARRRGIRLKVRQQRVHSPLLGPGGSKRGRRNSDVFFVDSNIPLPPQKYKAPPGLVRREPRDRALPDAWKKAEKLTKATAKTQKKKKEESAKITEKAKARGAAALRVARLEQEYKQLASTLGDHEDQTAPPRSRPSSGKETPSVTFPRQSTLAAKSLPLRSNADQSSRKPREKPDKSPNVTPVTHNIQDDQQRAGTSQAEAPLNRVVSINQEKSIIELGTDIVDRVETPRSKTEGARENRTQGVYIPPMVSAKSPEEAYYSPPPISKSLSAKLVSLEQQKSRTPPPSASFSKHLSDAMDWIADSVSGSLMSSDDETDQKQEETAKITEKAKARGAAALRVARLEQENKQLASTLGDHEDQNAPPRSRPSSGKETPSVTFPRQFTLAAKSLPLRSNADQSSRKPREKPEKSPNVTPVTHNIQDDHQRAGTSQAEAPLNRVVSINQEKSIIELGTDIVDKVETPRSKTEGARENRTQGVYTPPMVSVKSPEEAYYSPPPISKPLSAKLVSLEQQKSSKSPSSSPISNRLSDSVDKRRPSSSRRSTVRAKKSSPRQSREKVPADKQRPASSRAAAASTIQPNPRQTREPVPVEKMRPHSSKPPAASSIKPISRKNREPISQEPTSSPGPVVSSSDSTPENLSSEGLTDLRNRRPNKLLNHYIKQLLSRRPESLEALRISYSESSFTERDSSDSMIKVNTSVAASLVLSSENSMSEGVSQQDSSPRRSFKGASPQSMSTRRSLVSMVETSEEHHGSPRTPHHSLTSSSGSYANINIVYNPGSPNASSRAGRTGSDQSLAGVLAALCARQQDCLSAPLGVDLDTDEHSSSGGNETIPPLSPFLARMRQLDLEGPTSRPGHSTPKNSASKLKTTSHRSSSSSSSLETGRGGISSSMAAGVNRMSHNSSLQQSQIQDDPIPSLMGHLASQWASISIERPPWLEA